MSTTKQSAEALALRGLLLLVVEVQNIVHRYGNEADYDGGQAVCDIDEVVESAPARELIQLARAALEMPAARQVFYGIVCEQDLPKGHRSEDTAKGPIIMECYLNGLAKSRDETEAFAKRMGFDRYGWVRVAEIHVDMPQSQAAIPAAVAGIHK